MHKLGELLRKYRTERDFTMQKVADYMEISNPYLSDLENGKALRPKIHMLQKAAEFLGISTDELIISAEKIPPDVYWKIVHHPELLEVIRALKV